jgi:hypothetical protein
MKFPQKFTSRQTPMATLTWAASPVATETAAIAETTAQTATVMLTLITEKLTITDNF